MELRPSPRSQIVERRTYLRPLDDTGTTFETYEMSLDRIVGHQRWLWERAVNRKLNVKEKRELQELRELMLERKVTVSGRTRWLGGTEIAKKHEITNFNCCFIEIKDVHSVVDAFWCLLCGAGVGFRAIPGAGMSGFSHHIPEVEVISSKMTKEIWDAGIRGRDTNLETFDRESGTWTISVGDCAKAWAKSIGKLLAGKFKAKKLVLDFTQIRPAGVRLKSFGWISSGDTSIATAYLEIVNILNSRSDQMLTRIDILDIMNLLGTVLSSRRSAEIALMDYDEPEAQEFIVAKKDYWSKDVGKWWRGSSNNTIMFSRVPSREELEDIFNKMQEAGGSEPGFLNREEALRRAPYFRGSNPCNEIALASSGVCNLVETILPRFNGDMKGLLRAHYLIARANYRQTCVDFRDGILQAVWNENNSFLRLCGVGVTGTVAWDGQDDPLAWQALREAASSGADSMADELHSPRSKNVTTIKPSGCRPSQSLVTCDNGIFMLGELMPDHPPGEAWADYRGEAKAILRNGELGRISKTFDNGMADVYEITTRFGFQERSTANHMWSIIGKGWTRTDEIQPGDQIELNPGVYQQTNSLTLKKVHPAFLNPHGTAVEIQQPDVLDEDLSWFLGYLHGDGALSVSKYRVRFVDSFESNLIKAARVLFDKFGLKCSYKQMTDRNAFSMEVGSRELWNWLIANDLHKNDWRESIPLPVRQSSTSSIIAFLAGLFDADGCVCSTGSRLTLTLTQADGWFIRNVQDVSAAVGLIFGRSLNSQGMNLQGNKAIRLCGLSASSDLAALEVFSVNSTKAAAGNFDPSSWHSTRNFAKAIVQSVEPIGKMRTMDVEVDHHHYFHSGALVSHNTASKTMGLEGFEVPEGIHKPLSRFIFNRIIVGQHDPLLNILADASYTIEPHPFDPASSLVVVPVEFSNIEFDKVHRTMPDGREVVLEVNMESAVQQLNRYKIVMDNYVDHNASVTVSYSPDEVPAIIDWLTQNWSSYYGVSFLYRTDPTKTAEDLGYPYLPQQPVDEKTFREYASTLKPIDLTGLSGEDEVDTGGECATGACPIR